MLTIVMDLRSDKGGQEIKMFTEAEITDLLAQSMAEDEGIESYQAKITKVRT